MDFNRGAAVELLQGLIAAGDSLAHFPHRGRAVPGRNMRELVTADASLMFSPPPGLSASIVWSRVAIPLCSDGPMRASRVVRDAYAWL